MVRRWLLTAAVALLAGQAQAATLAVIRLPEAPTPQTDERLAKTEPLLERLLAEGVLPPEGPFVGAGARYARLSPKGLRPGLSREESEELRAGLRALWGESFELQDLVEAVPAKRGPVLDRKDSSVRVAARLDVGSSLERQNLHYDGAIGRAAPAAMPAASAVGAASAAASRPAPLPAAAPRAAHATVPPSPSVAAKPEGVRWGKVGIEILKGAGETVRSVFTWRGLATAAAAVAIVTVAPVAVSAFLAVGAAVGGYTVGKALYDGVRAYRKGDAEGVYAASREFGTGALTLGLSFYGARHTPTNLRPHLPKAGEFKALLSSMDDEAVVAATVLDKIRGK